MAARPTRSPPRLGCWGEPWGSRWSSCGRRELRPCQPARPLPARTSSHPRQAGGLGDSPVQREAGGSLEGHPSARDVESLVNEGRCLRLLHQLSACALAVWEPREQVKGAASSPAAPTGTGDRPGNARATLIEEERQCPSTSLSPRPFSV